MNYKKLRERIRSHLSSKEAVKNFLVNNIGIDITRDGFFKVRLDDTNPSCQINRDGSCHDYGTGDHYSDLVSLLYDGYHAFDSLPEIMEWICNEINIDTEVYCG